MDDLHKWTGPTIRLEPLTTAHGDALYPLADDPAIWRFNPPQPATRVEFDRYVQRGIDRKVLGEQTFAVIDRRTDRAVGLTRLGRLDPALGTVEIGGTWLGRSHRGTAANGESKRLLIDHAFTQLGAHAVLFRCDDRNMASRRAVERIGATCVGTMPSGSVDVVWYRISAADWPTKRADLDRTLSWTTLEAATW